jgi:hypothetical protein
LRHMMGWNTVNPASALAEPRPWNAKVEAT